MKQADVYERITERVIAKLEAGVVPWRKTWAGAEGWPKNLMSGKTYRGINLFLLACSDHASPYWLTFNQAKELGGSVKKGEKATPVTFWKWYDKEDKATGEVGACQFQLKEGGVGVTVCFPEGEGAGPQAPSDYVLVPSRHEREGGIFRANVRTGELSVCYVFDDKVVCTPMAK